MTVIPAPAQESPALAVVGQWPPAVVQATADLVGMSGAIVAGIAMLIELSFLNGREKLPGLDIRSLYIV